MLLRAARRPSSVFGPRDFLPLAQEASACFLVVITEKSYSQIENQRQARSAWPPGTGWGRSQQFAGVGGREVVEGEGEKDLGMVGQGLRRDWGWIVRRTQWIIVASGVANPWIETVNGYCRDRGPAWADPLHASIAITIDRISILTYTRS